jgi:hypothetical protein
MLLQSTQGLLWNVTPLHCPAPVAWQQLHSIEDTYRPSPNHHTTSSVAAHVPGTWPDLLSEGPSAPLRTLALSSNAFVGSLPAAWPPVLPRLEVLDLSYNTLTGPLPTDLSALPYLSML